MARRDPNQGFAFYINGSYRNFNTDSGFVNTKDEKREESDLSHDIQRILMDTFDALEAGLKEPEEILDILAADIDYLKKNK